MKFSENEYSSDASSKKTRCRRCCNINLLTFTGIILIMPLELLENISKITSLFGAVFGCYKGYNSVKGFFAGLKRRLLDLNDYQLEQLE